MSKRRQGRKEEPEGKWYRSEQRWQYNYRGSKILTEFFRKGKKDKKGSGVVLSSGGAWAVITRNGIGLKAKVTLGINFGSVEAWTWVTGGMKVARKWCHDTAHKLAKVHLMNVYKEDSDDQLVVKRPLRPMRPATRLRLLRRNVEDYTEMYEEQIAGMRREIAKLEARKRTRKSRRPHSDLQPYFEDRGRA